MLLHMFDNRSMPLYELCDRIILNRIESKHYKTYLNKISKKTWGKVLDDDVIELIMDTSERHPKRIYNLCFYLWRLCQDKKSTPKLNDVIKSWDMYMKIRLKDIRYNLSRQSAGQIKLLTLIAMGMNKQLSGKDAQRKTNMAGSSILNAISTLEENDYVEKLKDGTYRIIDPLIKDVLIQYEHNNL